MRILKFAANKPFRAIHVFAVHLNTASENANYVYCVNSVRWLNLTVVSSVNVAVSRRRQNGAGVKCEVRGGKMRGTGARLAVIGRRLAGHLALYPTAIKLHRRRQLSRGGLLNGNRRPLGSPASPSLHITSTVAVALRDIESISDTVD